MSKIQLSEEQLRILAEHHMKALREQKNVIWLDELAVIKKNKLVEYETQLQKINISIEELKKSLSEVEAHKTNIVQMVNGELQMILSDIINQQGLPPNSKVLLSFKEGLPQLEIQTNANEQ